MKYAESTGVPIPTSEETKSYRDSLLSGKTFKNLYSFYGDELTVGIESSMTKGDMDMVLHVLEKMRKNGMGNLCLKRLAKTLKIAYELYYLKTGDTAIVFESFRDKLSNFFSAETVAKMANDKLDLLDERLYNVVEAVDNYHRDLTVVLRKQLMGLKTMSVEEDWVLRKKDKY